MNLTSLLTILEAGLDRQTVNYQGLPTIAYRGTINQVTVNSEDEYTNVHQLLLTNDNGTVTLHINHTGTSHLTDYALTDITDLVIT